MTVDATVETVRSADGTSIAFERTGTGPALILVDAALCYRGFGPTAPLAAELASSFAVITYDRRGRGESTDTPPYAVEREVEDLQALVDAAGGSAYAYGFSSGAVLLLHAALAGVAAPKLALLEPPLPLEDEPDESDLGPEVAELVAAGRRGDAVEHFNKSIGVPEEMLAGMRDAPFWPALEQAAHTLVYDTTITSSLPLDRLSGITTTTLVLSSEGSDERLPTWGRWLRDTLPTARSARWRASGTAFRPRTSRRCLRSSSPPEGRSRSEKIVAMIQRGLPTPELREEHRGGVPDAFARLEQAIKE